MKVYNHSIKAWLIATRPWSFPASAMPVVVCTAYLYGLEKSPDWLMALWTLVTILLFHATGNTWSDYNDYKKGVDREDTIGGTSITSGEFSLGEIKRLSFILLGVSVLSGLMIAAVAGLPVLYFGLAGFILTILYPWLKYRALGDVDILLTYSLLPLLGTSYVVTGAIQWEACWLVLPIGLITVGILHSNNMRDSNQDRRAEIETFAMKIGARASAVIYAFEVLFPFVAVAVCAVTGIFPILSLIVFSAVKIAWNNALMAMKYQQMGMEAMRGIDERTAQLQLIFSMLLSVSFLISGFLADNPIF